MGSIVTDCCVTDQLQKTRLENEGSSNMDTVSQDASLLNNSNTNNPSIYAKQPDAGNTIESTQSFDGTRRSTDSLIHETTPNSPPSEAEHEPEPITDSQSDPKQDALPEPPSVTIIEPEPESPDTTTADVNHKQKLRKSGNSSFKIVVTEPLSPAYKLQGEHKSFWSDDHPYSLHKQRQNLLSDGFIRRNNITSISLPGAIKDLIFDFYYFHYADHQSQLSILRDKKKQKQSIALATAESGNEENLAQFLRTILNSKLAEKMWKKFDSSLKGQVETDKFAQFLILPVILYKSTLIRRKNKNSKQKKPHFDKKAIKHEVEHLAVWIMTTHGEKQVDNSYHFVLTKKLYKTELTGFIQEYIQTFGE